MKPKAAASPPVKKGASLANKTAAVRKTASVPSTSTGKIAKKDKGEKIKPNRLENLRRGLLKIQKQKEEDTAQPELTAEEEAKMKDSLEAQRLNSIMTRKLKVLHDLKEQLAKNKIDKAEYEKQHKLQFLAIDREAMDDLDKDNIRREDEPVVYHGDLSKLKRGQIGAQVAKPFDKDQDDKVVHVGVTPANQEYVTAKIRFDLNHVISTKRLMIPAKNGKSTMEVPYWCWLLTRVRLGESDEEEKMTRSGKLKKAFGFSGKLSTLPELHLALRTLLAMSVQRKFPSRKEVAANPVKYQDEFEIVDLFRFIERVYPDPEEPGSRIGFADFLVYAETASYKTLTGAVNQHKVISIAKKKSDDAMKKAGPNSPTEFVMQIPVRNIICLVHSIGCLMEINSMRSLPLRPELTEAPEVASLEDLSSVVDGSPDIVEVTVGEEEEEEGDEEDEAEVEVVKDAEAEEEEDYEPDGDSGSGSDSDETDDEREGEEGDEEEEEEATQQVDDDDDDDDDDGADGEEDEDEDVDAEDTTPPPPPPPETPRKSRRAGKRKAISPEFVVEPLAKKRKPAEAKKSPTSPKTSSSKSVVAGKKVKK